ncbi:MAG: succinate dehydrogenase, cytochrome b556 subunit [Legionella sp.]|nr:MAG: succinate dehydrogenase, cytochrome b556 subunit [Legionella sp.]PJD98000.1 MAG: succinate dehydrogenase, cytochrome b556 subunit [Legionella sp.]
MNKKRPVNLDLGTLKFPVMAIASIFHRISGIVLFLLLPFILYFWGQSLHSEAAFLQVKADLSVPLFQILIWAFGTAFIYHTLAGIRHVIMDLGYGESLCAGRRSAALVIALAVISTLLLGVWLW